MATGKEARMTTVETALGPVPAAELGPTLMHEHIVTRSPGVHENWPHLFDRAGILALAERKMADLYARGIRTIVDLTTVDLGRDIDLIAAVARRSRVHVIAATGVWWMPQRYFSAHGVDAVAELFIRDITQGIGASGVKAAIIKCATDTAGVTPVIENILRASARAQKATGVPISTHTWAPGRSGEAQQAIFAQEGVDLSRVIIGHSGDSDDLGYLRGLMERGSTIGMDRFGLEHYLPTAKRVEVLARLCAEGYAGKMVLSHDANCWTDMLSEDDKRRTRPLWHYNHISDDILPALRTAGVSDAQLEQMLVRNPRAIFEASAGPARPSAL
jgi:phosphotriesterase-related protein